jgi:hypothetical protein
VATSLQGPFEIAHVGILLGIDATVREEDGEVVDVELHGEARPAALDCAGACPPLSKRSRAENQFTRLESNRVADDVIHPISDSISHGHHTATTRIALPSLTILSSFPPGSMSKKFKSQASSARAANATFGSPAFGFGGSSFQTTSSISYIAEQPDLSGVSDPHVIVSLRNLGKKDSTTKTKALEELQEYVQTVGSNVEDSVVAAWVRRTRLHDYKVLTLPRLISTLALP